MSGGGRTDLLPSKAGSVDGIPSGAWGILSPLSFVGAEELSAECAIGRGSLKECFIMAYPPLQWGAHLLLVAH